MDYEARSKGTARVPDSQRLVVDRATLAGEDFRGRNLVQFSSAGSRFEGCRFDGIRIESGSFGAGRIASEYIECVFDQARITMGAGGYARFERCSFLEVELKDWFCFAVELVDCEFSGKLRKAVFNGTVPTDKAATIGRVNNEFRGNDFSALDMVDVSFRTGIDLSRQRLPGGQDYLYLPDAAESVKLARAEVVAWTDLELRKQALTVLSVLEADVAGGQRQLLLRAADYPRRTRAAIDGLFSTLRSSLEPH